MLRRYLPHMHEQHPGPRVAGVLSQSETARPPRRRGGRSTGGRPSAGAGRTRAGWRAAKPSGSAPRQAHAAPAGRGQQQARARVHGGAVELVAGDPGAGRGERAVGQRHRVAVAEGQRRGHRGVRVEHPAHRGAVEGPARATAGPAHSATIGPPAAASAATATRSGSLADSSAAYTSGKPPPTTSARVPVRQRLVAQRVDGDHLGAGAGQQLGRLRVREGESRTTGQRDHRTARHRLARPRGPRRGRERRRGAGDREHRVQVDARRRPARPARRPTRRPRRGARPPGTRPRCRDGAATASARRSAPSTGVPTSSQASRSSASCRSEPTRLRITPAMRTSPKLRKPCTSAATERPCAAASTTRIDRRVEQRRRPARWSRCRPRRYARRTGPSRPRPRRGRRPAAPCANSGPIRSSPTSTGSRLRPGRPAASAW